MYSHQGIVFITALTLCPVALIICVLRAQYVFMGMNSAVLITTLGILDIYLIKAFFVPFFFNPFEALPSPPNARFFMGHGLAIFKRPAGPIFLRWMQEIPNSGLIYFRSIAHKDAVLLPTAVETNMEVLNSHCYDWVKPPPASNILARLIGNGLVVSEGQEHKIQRKSVTAAFHGKHIRGLVPLFWSKSQEFVETLQREIHRPPPDSSKSEQAVLDIQSWASKVTLDIIGVTGVGCDFGTLQNSDDELARIYEELFSRPLTLFFAINIIFPPWLLRVLPIKTNRIIQSSASKLRRLCLRMMDEKEQSLQFQAISHVDILSILMESGNFSKQGLVDQLLTFLAAGHDTTSTTFSWTMFLLATHPAVQDKLRIEVVATLSQQKEMNADIIDSMPYLTAVCQEVLRFYPTVPSTARVAIRDTIIGDQPVPKGTHCCIVPWALNRYEGIWGDDAAQFKPERWIGEQNSSTGGASNKLALFTFLHGPRSCIGQGFARSELKCLVAAFVSRFFVEMADKGAIPIPAGAFTIKPKDGMWVRLKAVVN